MKHTLAPLPYAHDALEPYIDAKTMEIHHGKHHQAYVDKLNAALEKHPEFQSKSAEELIKHLAAIPEDIRAAVRNNAGGHVNHTFFWHLLKKDVAMPKKVEDALIHSFGSVEKFKEQLTAAGMNRFGSGWAWLVKTHDGLAIVSTANQDNPLMGKAIAGCEGTPVLGIDVWEHAYYLKYQNKRNEYLAQILHTINWDEVAKHM